MTEKLTIDLLQVLKNCITLCRQFPDAKYERTGVGFGSCLYTRGKGAEGCGCLIGQAIQMLGQEYRDYLFLIENEHLEKKNAGSLGDVSGLMVRHFKILENEQATDILNILNDMQYQQDTDRTWYYCFEVSMPRLKKLGITLT